MTKKSLILSTLITLFLGIGMEANAIDRASLIAFAQSLKGKKGASLKAALMPLLKPDSTFDYGGKGTNNCTWAGFYRTDRNAETNECYNRYSSKKFYFDDNYNNRAIKGMNIEHSFPKSWWGGAKNDAYRDLYNLYPSDASANSAKSNYPMDEVSEVKSEEPGYDKVGKGAHIPYNNSNSKSQAWEPGDQFKGDFARSYMYMAVAYGDLTFVNTGLQTMTNEDYPGLKEWASTLYIQWGKQDSVSVIERNRNNAVAEIEGNRNLFIDYPHLDEYVWGDSVDVEFNPETSISTADDDDRYMKSDVVDAIKTVYYHVAKKDDDAIYTIQGAYVGKELEALPQGLYIRNGKKIIKR